jgi:hypothetical protein
VAGLRLFDGEDAAGVGGFGEPARQGLAQDACAALALAGDDQQAAAPGRLLAGDEGVEGAVGLGLGQAVQVEAGLDLGLEALWGHVT